MATSECAISALARRTPLRDEEKALALQRYNSDLKKDSTVGDSILPFYFHLLLRGTLQEKMRAVRERPDLVERCFTLFHDRELGQLYVDQYGDSGERHHTAYFISAELGVPIRRRLPVSGDGYEFDKETRDFYLNKNSQNKVTTHPRYGVNGAHQA